MIIFIHCKFFLILFCFCFKDNSHDSFSDTDDSSIVSGLTNLYLNKSSDKTNRLHSVNSCRNLPRSQTANSSNFLNESSFYQSTRSSNDTTAHLNKSDVLLSKPNSSQIWLRKPNLNKSIF